MAKFVYIFVGGNPPKDKRDENMKEWADWINRLSKKGAYEGGLPFGWSKKVVSHDESVTDYKGENSGYALINADSMEYAIEMATGAPHHKHGGKTEVYDTLEM